MRTCVDIIIAKIKPDVIICISIVIDYVTAAVIQLSNRPGSCVGGGVVCVGGCGRRCGMSIRKLIGMFLIGMGWGSAWISLIPGTWRLVAYVLMMTSGLFLMTRLEIKFFLAWYDGWVGYYYDRKEPALYICPLPMCVVKIW